MRLAFRFFLFVLVSIPIKGWSQSSANSKIPRVLILLDGSSSMTEEWMPGKTRFQQAGKFILQLIDSLSQANEQVQFGLRVFGHQYPSQEKNCFDTKREIMFARGNAVQMEARLQALHGYGVSPIAYSLSEAAMEDFENEAKYAYSIILVTDGGESCGGDICKVVNDLLQRKIFFRPYIVSLVDYEPLKDLYKCLGTFLTVSNEPQMPVTISKITEAHREGFDRAKTGKVINVMPDKPKQDTIIIPITVKKEEIKKVEPPIIVKKDTLTPPKKVEPVKPVVPDPPIQVRNRKIYPRLRLNTTLRAYKTIEIFAPSPKAIRVTSFKMSEIGDAPPEPPKPIIIERKKEKSYGRLKFAKMKAPKTALVVLPSPRKITVDPIKITKLEPELAKASDTIVIPITIKKETPKPIVKSVVKPTVTPSVKPVVKKEPSPFVVEKTPSAETEVEIYFTDGNGKFYNSVPQILLTDPKTGKDVHTFYRTINKDGDPDPVKLMAGTFNLSVIGSDRTFLKEIVIEPLTKNKITITVGMGSLQFVWKTGNAKKPVDKYLAQVKRNFVPQPTITQKCDTILPYPPGNYHIEINTLPVSVRSVDLVFGALITIPIDVPGMVQFTNSNNLGKVTLYYPLGDKYLKFWQINISGNPSTQSLELKPGPYEAHYTLAPGLPEKVIKFQVTSDQTTNVELQ